MAKRYKTTPQLMAPDALETVVRTIVEAKKPQKIILFGSHAEGKARWDSDIDLLVIMHAEGALSQRALEIRRLFQTLPGPMDVFVYTPAEVAYWQDVTSSFISHMLKHGIVLYEREPETAHPGLGAQS